MLQPLYYPLWYLLLKHINSEHERASRWNNTTLCPYISKWRERAIDFCGDRYSSYNDVWTRYHCVGKQDNGGYVEVCINPILVVEGYYPVWSSGIEPQRLYIVRCPTGYYQPLKGWSNKINKCKMKSECSGRGQLSSWCPDGGTVDDQQCRCDFQQGYISELFALQNPLNKSCFTPSRENSVCHFYECESDKELDRTYRCVQKCPENWYRPPQELECYQNLSKSTVSLTKPTKCRRTKAKELKRRQETGVSVVRINTTLADIISGQKTTAGNRVEQSHKSNIQTHGMSAVEEKDYQLHEDYVYLVIILLLIFLFIF